MQLGTIALVLLAAWLGTRWLRTRVRQSHDGRLPPGVTPPSVPLLDGHDTGGHYDACLAALRAFATEYRLTFQHGRCTQAAVLSLHALRDDVLRHLYALRMRLPNDLGAEAKLTKDIEDTDVLLQAYVQDARARCGTPLLHPGPIDDVHYRQWYRAANDVLA